MTVHKKKARVALLSVISNSILVAMKLLIGLLIGSVSVISEAIHSGVDLVAAGIALFAVKKAAKPADTRHPFGHGKIRSVWSWLRHSFDGFQQALVVDRFGKYFCFRDLDLLFRGGIRREE